LLTNANYAGKVEYKPAVSPNSKRLATPSGLETCVWDTAIGVNPLVRVDARAPSRPLKLADLRRVPETGNAVPVTLSIGLALSTHALLTALGVIALFRALATQDLEAFQHFSDELEPARGNVAENPEKCRLGIFS
jgi:hypothetical protein